jgi:hypothetical protein
VSIDAASLASTSSASSPIANSAIAHPEHDADVPADDRRAARRVRDDLLARRSRTLSL